MGGVLGFAGFGVAIFALISGIISVAIEYWFYSNQGGIKTYAGLWKTCVEGGGVKLCSSDGATDELRAVQAMVILGLLSNIVAVICAALKLFHMKESKILGYAATGLLIAAGLFMMIGFSVYVSEIYEPIKVRYDLHAGFAFCIIAWLAAWIAAALFGLAATK